MSSQEIDEDELRLTADFLWKQDGRPGLAPSHFWQKALETHRKAHANGLELDAGLALQGETRPSSRSPVSDPHEPKEGDTHGAREPASGKEAR